MTENKVSDEQGGFRKGKSCVDQIFAIIKLMEDYFRKDRKLYAAYMDLEKTYDRIHRKVLWNVVSRLILMLSGPSYPSFSTHFKTRSIFSLCVSFTRSYKL